MKYAMLALVNEITLKLFPHKTFMIERYNFDKPSYQTVALAALSKSL